MNELENKASTIAMDSLLNYETVKVSGIYGIQAYFWQYFNNERLETERYEKVLEKHDVACIINFAINSFHTLSQL